MFQLATRAVSYFIEHFGMRELFGRENYEYYARLTGRILKVEVKLESFPFLRMNEFECVRMNGSSSRILWTIWA